MRALIGALLVAGCVVAHLHRLPAWRSDEALWRAAHRVSPTQPRPLVNLGAEALRRGAVTQAEEWWTRALVTGRLTEAQRRAVCEMRQHAAVLYGDPASPVEDCS